MSVSACQRRAALKSHAYRPTCFALIAIGLDCGNVHIAGTRVFKRSPQAQPGRCFRLSHVIGQCSDVGLMRGEAAGVMASGGTNRDDERDALVRTLRASLAGSTRSYEGLRERW